MSTNEPIAADGGVSMGLQAGKQTISTETSAPGEASARSKPEKKARIRDSMLAGFWLGTQCSQLLLWLFWLLNYLWLLHDRGDFVLPPPITFILLLPAMGVAALSLLSLIMGLRKIAIGLVLGWGIFAAALTLIYSLLSMV